MRIGLQAWGTEGDIRPFIALAAGLSAAGHKVTLAVTEIWSGDYSSWGDRFGFRVLHPGSISVTGQRLTELAGRMVSSPNPATKARLLIDNFFDPAKEEIFQVSRKLCRSSDLVIGHLFVYPLRVASMLSGVPFVSLYTAPLFSSSHVPAPGFPMFMGRLSWRIFSGILDHFWKADMTELYMSEGLKPPKSIMENVFRSDHLNLVSTSPSIYPAHRARGFHLCGAMPVPGTGPGDIPAELEDFLSAGAKPVYVTFGSMCIPEVDHLSFADSLAKACLAAGSRAVVQLPGLKHPRRTGEDVILVGGVPHPHVFPRCSMVVHHGGCGTSHAACASGVPSVVVAYTSDQPLMARLLEKAGVAPGMLFRRNLTERKLTARIRRVLSRGSYFSAAAELGRRMKREDGVARAVELVESTFRSGSVDLANPAVY